MEKHLEAVSNLDKARSHFEGLAYNYIDNLVASTERKAQAEAQAKALKKAKDLELKKELAVKVDRIYRKMKKMGLLDEVKTH